MTVEVDASVITGLIVGKSFALLAFGGDSFIELISACAAWNYLRKPGKGILATGAESEMTEKIATALLILLIPIIAGGAFYSYFLGIVPETSTLGIAVDSLSHFAMFIGEDKLRLEAYRLICFIKAKGLSSVYLWESPQLMGTSFTIAEVGLSFLVDSILLSEDYRN